METIFTLIFLKSSDERMMDGGGSVGGDVASPQPVRQHHRA